MRLLVLAILLLASSAQAQTASLTVSRTKVTVNTGFEAELRFEGGTIQGNPRLGNTEGFQIQSAGRETSVQMSRGRVQQSTIFRYSVVPTRVGTFTLGPFSARVDDRSVTSNPVTVEVTARPAGGGKASAAPTEDWFIEADVDDERPFVGESFLYRLRVGSATRSRDPAWGSLESEGLTAEPGVRIEPRNARRLIDSRTWTVSEILVPLFGVEPGPAEVAPVDAVLPVVVAGGGLFARTREIQLRSDPVGVTLRPLPTAGRPDDFSGAVGTFGLRASLQPQTLAAGETATLTLVLEGEGAARNPEPSLVLPDTVRAYDEDPQRQVQVTEDGLTTRVVFRTALVPLSPGTVDIPPVRFSYFDPETERYATATAGPFRLEVGGTAVADAVAATALQPGKAEVELLGSDILALHDPASPRRARPLGLGSPVVLLLLIVPFAAWGAGALTGARRRSAGTEAGRLRGRAKEAKAAVKEARSAAAADDWEGAERALRRWIGAKVGRESAGASLSPDEAGAVVVAAGCPEPLGAALGSLLGRVEAARYGGAGTAGLASDLSAWLDDAAGAWR